MSNVKCYTSKFTQDILAFHEKFKLEPLDKPGFLSEEQMQFRTNFLYEELEEFVLATKDGDLTKAFDALIDLQYVLLGTAHLMGLPFDEGWDIVQAANMKKVRAVRPEDSKRGSGFDVVKPEGWVAPDAALQALIMEEKA